MSNRYFERRFLNPEGMGGLASILAIVPNAEPDDIYKEDPTLEISDCHRTVSFDIDLFDFETFFVSMHKLDELIRVLGDFRSSVVHEFEHRQSNLLLQSDGASRGR